MTLRGTFGAIQQNAKLMKKAIWVIAFLGLIGTKASATILFSDSFSYADGAITAVSGGVWTNHSGTANQVDV